MNILDPKALLEIAIIAVVLYFVLQFMKGTRGAGILKGLVFIFVLAIVTISFVSVHWSLPRIDYLLSRFLAASVLALIIIFQPELRRALIRLGQSPVFGAFLARGETRVIQEIVEASEFMSKNRIGALMALVREVRLDGYVEGGVKLDAEISREMLTSIFWPGSPLHDGAAIIEHGRIAAAGCILPLSDDPTIAKSMATRHRAGIGITEETDCVAVIVSEETGRISVAVRGQVTTDHDGATLRRVLHNLILTGRKGEPFEESTLSEGG